MQWWQIIITITGVNGASFICFIWWLRGWFEVTKANQEKVNDLSERVDDVEHKQIETDMTIKDVGHDIEMLRKDMNHSLLIIQKGTDDILKSMKEKAEDDRMHRIELEGYRKRTQSTLEAISHNMESQCNLATEALKAAAVR